jgi:hypothetical protein
MISKSEVRIRIFYLLHWGDQGYPYELDYRGWHWYWRHIVYLWELLIIGNARLTWSLTRRSARVCGLWW